MRASWLAGMGAAILILAQGASGEARAADKATAGKPAAAQAAREMTLVGTVEKHEKLKKDGTPMMTWFTLACEDGIATHLPKGKVEPFAGVRVRLVGTGTETTKRGKAARDIESITSIEKAEAPAPAGDKK